MLGAAKNSWKFSFIDEDGQKRTKTVAGVNLSADPESSSGESGYNAAATAACFEMLCASVLSGAVQTESLVQERSWS